MSNPYLEEELGVGTWELRAHAALRIIERHLADAEMFPAADTLSLVRQTLLGEAACLRAGIGFCRQSLLR